VSGLIYETSGSPTIYENPVWNSLDEVACPSVPDMTVSAAVLSAALNLIAHSALNIQRKLGHCYKRNFPPSGIVTEDNV
jgi:hypothetical protein